MPLIPAKGVQLQARSMLCPFWFSTTKDRFRLVMTALNQSEIPGEMMGFLSVLVQVIWLKSSTSLLLNCLSSWFDCNVQLCQVKTEDWPGYM